MLRAARQAQGLHIAALATFIKVTPARLEALEAGRIADLVDTTFARALALTVCRVLKIDAAPVLALMPGAPSGSLGRVDGGLNTPFRERQGSVNPGDWMPWRHPLLWLAGLLVAAAIAFVLVPGKPASLAPAATGAAAAPVMPPSAAGLGNVDAPALASGDAASASLAMDGQPPAAAAVAVSGAAVVGQPVAVAVAASASAAGRPGNSTDLLLLRATQATWVQVTDASGQTLMARLVPAGESVELTPALPVRLRIGNVRGTELQFRGQPVALPASRENIANLTLP